MGKIFTALLLFSVVHTSIFSQAEEIPPPEYIRTVQFSGGTSQSQLPIIRLGERLRLSFDALNGDEADFYYVITHHNFDWSESDLSKGEYLNGFDDVRIETYENSLNTLQIFSHYFLDIPNRETRAITKSGNYLITIYDDDGMPVFSRRFKSSNIKWLSVPPETMSKSLFCNF